MQLEGRHKERAPPLCLVKYHTRRRGLAFQLAFFAVIHRLQLRNAMEADCTRVCLLGAGSHIKLLLHGGGSEAAMHCAQAWDRHIWIRRMISDM